MRRFVLILLLVCRIAVCQTDTLIFLNGNHIYGEIEYMDRGVLDLDASYGDENFKIEWDKISEIYTESQFLVELSDGSKYFSRLASTADLRIKLYDTDTVYRICYKNEIVYLDSYKDDFGDRLSASIELGLDMAQAKNLNQLSTRSTVGYSSEKWSVDASLNSLRSRQDDTDPIERSDGEMNYRYVLPFRWYTIATASILRNTEQRLDKRVNTQLGFGNFLIRTNKAYWGLKAGGNHNIEIYSNDTENRDSWEAFVGIELNLFDIGDLNLLLVSNAYPGITEKKRFRSDTNLDVKYDLPLDFFIRLGVSFNYDNKPANNASETDYVIRTGIGWEW